MSDNPASSKEQYKAPITDWTGVADGVTGRSPLAHVGFDELAQMTPSDAPVHLREHALKGHLTLRCNPEDAAQTAAFEAVTGLALPTAPLSSVASSDTTVRWIAPDEWLISVPASALFSLQQRLQDALTGHCALVDVSSGLTVFELSGERAVDVLKKCVPVDLHLRHFPAGKVVSTGFAKASCTLRRLNDETFELVVRRSFADYIWLWLQDASLEYGLRVEN